VGELRVAFREDQPPLTRFGRAQLVAFLRALDRHLRQPHQVVVIGGAAAAVAYDSGTKTTDVDLFSGLSQDIVDAAARAREETGLGIAVGAAAVADLPYHYEARLRPARGLRLEKLRLLFPDKYDLALAKAVRGYEHDLDAIAGIHRRHRLSRRTLVGRFEAEMTHAVGDRARLRLNLVLVVARLYGAVEARRLAGRWGLPTPA
jgi:hypothetical protein